MNRLGQTGIRGLAYAFPRLRVVVVTSSRLTGDSRAEAYVVGIGIGIGIVVDMR
jgi:hypothetical protein